MLDLCLHPAFVLVAELGETALGHLIEPKGHEAITGELNEVARLVVKVSCDCSILCAY